MNAKGCVVVFWAVAVIGSPSQAQAQARLACQEKLAHADCSEFTGAWPAADPLQFIASCQECTGSGADLHCGLDEMIRAQDLGLEKVAGLVAVPGTFSQQKLCIGLPLFRFNGTLEAGQSYNIFANVTGHGKVNLLQFTTAGGGTVTDASTTTGDAATTNGDAGIATGDAATTNGDAGSASGDSSSGGDAGVPGGDDGGCGCSTTGSLPALAWPLVVLFPMWRQRRRS